MQGGSRPELHRKLTGTMDPRGWTYSDEYRYQCEVRYVLAMPSAERRRAYLDGVQAARGKAAADRLRADVRLAWSLRTSATPLPLAQGSDLFARAEAEFTASEPPANGSFLALAHAGNSDPIEGVVSRGGGR